MDKIKVVIKDKQKEVKIPTGIRMLVRRCCNAVLQQEKFEGRPKSTSPLSTERKSAG